MLELQRWLESVTEVNDHELVVFEEPVVGSDDAVAIGVCVVAGRDLKLVTLFDQRSHCVWRRAVHADLPVPVESHEPPSRVDVGVHDGQVQAVALPDGAPVGDACAAQRVNPQSQARAPIEFKEQG